MGNQVSCCFSGKDADVREKSFDILKDKVVTKQDNAAAEIGAKQAYAVVDTVASIQQESKAVDEKKADNATAKDPESKPAAALSLGSQMVNAVTVKKDSKGQPLKDGGETDELPAEEQPAKGGPHQVHQLGPPKPPCEDMRLATMHALNLIDAPPDPEVENILKLVSSIFNTPAALVAFFDDKRIFIKEADGAFQVGDFPWRWSFCGWTMSSQNDQIMVVPDATKDARFADNYMVCHPDGPGVRFYAGTPLLASNGHRLGTLCFADTKARIFDAGQCLILQNLAEMVVRHVEKDIMLQLKQHDNKELNYAYANMKRAMDCIEHCVVLLDTGVPGFKIMYTNQAWNDVTGLDRDAYVGHSLSEAFGTAVGQTLPLPEHLEAVEKKKDLVVENACVLGTHDSGASLDLRRFTLKFRPATKESFDDAALPVGVPSFIPSGGTADPSAGRFYFMTVKLVEAKSSRSICSSTFTSTTTDSFAGLGSAVEGLEVGHLLGKGAYGKVYSGTWFGTPVAVKVIDQDLRQLNAAGGINIEAVLGAELRHPHIVTTLKYTVHHVAPTAANSTTYATGSTANANSANTASTSASGAGAKSNVTSKSMAIAEEGTESGSEQAAALCVVADNTVNNSAKSDDRASNQWALIDLTQKLPAKGDEQPAEVSNSATATSTITDSSAPTTSRVTAVNSKMSCVTDSFGWGSGGTMGIGSTMAAAQRASPEFDGEEHPVQTIIVMEYCDRGCLQDAVDRGWLRDVRSCVTGTPNVPALIATAIEMASALQYLHTRDVIHGDLSAFNVLLSSSGSTANMGNRGFCAKIADFGLARNLDIKTKIQTKTYGTLTHMPPETLLEGTLSKKMDVYSFGVLLWQMYNGSRPWAGLSHGQIIMTVMSKGKLTFPPSAPSDYVELAQACMAFEASQRPTFEQILGTLTQMQNGVKSM